MKMWLDTTFITLYDKDDYKGDCTGDCTDSSYYAIQFPGVEPLSLEDDICALGLGTFRQQADLYIQKCTPDRWLVCHPVGQGRLVVVDSQAYALLALFLTPRTLDEVLTLQTTEPSQSVIPMIALLYKTGLLQRADMPSLPLKDEEQLHRISAWLHVTNACNLRCHYCYVEKTNEHMPENVAQQAVDAIFRSAARRQIQHIYLKYAGGEASLHMNSVIALHDYATILAQEHSITLRGTLLSNGVVLSQRAIDQVKTRNIGVAISLDGVDPSHDSQRPFIHGQNSFHYVDRTIKRLLSNGLLPHINVTVSRRNLAGLPELLIYILKYDMPFTLSYYRDNACVMDGKSLQFDEQTMIAAMREAFSVIERHLPRRSLLGSLIDRADLRGPHQRTCGVGHDYMVVDQHGAIAKCHADIKRTITTVHAEDPLQEIRNDRWGVQGLPVERKEGCGTCDWRYWCSGGCPLLTYRMTGRYDVKSPNCGIYKALFPEVLRLEALRLLKYEEPLSI